MDEADDEALAGALGEEALQRFMGLYSRGVAAQGIEKNLPVRVLYPGLGVLFW
ncbi:hypothetical protein [Streptomyces spiralis]|uniref:hypothetical protein n=1 Tax=Streptomyces spiralis TaxID=66376 RepID=UPI00367758FB